MELIASFFIGFWIGLIFPRKAKEALFSEKEMEDNNEE